jgi:hypothetical protein
MADGVMSSSLSAVRESAVPACRQREERIGSQLFKHGPVWNLIKASLDSIWADNLLVGPNTLKLKEGNNSFRNPHL